MIVFCNSRQVTNINSHYAEKMVTLKLIFNVKVNVGMKPLQTSHRVTQSQYPQDPQLLLSLMGTPH